MNCILKHICVRIMYNIINHCYWDGYWIFQQANAVFYYFTNASWTGPILKIVSTMKTYIIFFLFSSIDLYDCQTVKSKKSKFENEFHLELEALLYCTQIINFFFEISGNMVFCYSILRSKNLHKNPFFSSLNLIGIFILNN